MKKLSLELDALRVETFAPAADGEPRAGTVRAHDATYTCACPADTSVKIPCICSERQTCWDCV